MNILITGGAGFIGNHLVRYLVHQNPENKIIVVDNLSAGKIEFLGDIEKKITFYDIDIVNKEETNECFKKERPDIVIHLAAIHFIPECNQDPAKTILVNVAGTHNIIELVNQYQVKQLIFASSASVYGRSLVRKKEDDILKPLDIYGCSKLCGEQMIENLCKTNWTILRFFNVIGTNETHQHLLPVIVSQLERGNSLTLGNLDSIRDFLFVGDLVAGIDATIKNGKVFSQILNLGTGEGVSVRGVVEELKIVLRQAIEIDQNEKLKRDVDNPMLVASIEKSQKLINWQPRYSFQDALIEILSLKQGNC